VKNEDSQNWDELRFMQQSQYLSILETTLIKTIPISLGPVRKWLEKNPPKGFFTPVWVKEEYHHACRSLDIWLDLPAKISQQSLTEDALEPMFSKAASIAEAAYSSGFDAEPKIRELVMEAYLKGWREAHESSVPLKEKV
jgi:hypothetical protein